MVDSKNLDKQIQMKKSQIDKEIENELERSQKEIVKSRRIVEKINLISKNLASKIIEDITGEKLNESSVEAIIKEVSKNKLEKII